MFWDDEIFDEFKRMREELNRMASRINSSLGHRMLSHGKGSEKGKELDEHRKFRTPSADIQEKENKVIATFELPGADKEDIELNVTDNKVEVKVSKKAEKETKKKGAYSYSSFSQHFYRTLPLPAGVSAENADANYKNGVLTVEIPKLKLEEKKKKKIDIK